MSAATLNGITATFVRVSIPAWGVWHAEVETDGTTTPLAGSVTLVVDGLTLVGTVLSSGASQTRHRYRIAAGAAGWARELPGKAHVNDLGGDEGSRARRAQVVQDDAGHRIGDGGGASAAIYAWSPTNRVTFDYSFCIQNSILSMSRGGFPTFINVAAFDCTTNAFYVGNGGTMTFQGSSYGYVFGSANVAIPFYFGSNTIGQYTDKNRITVATTGADIFSFKGTTKIIATIPYSDATYYCRLISA